MRSRSTEDKKRRIKELYNKFPKRVELIDISSVKEWKDNPNNDYSKVPALAKIFKKFGQITPITVWEEDMVSYKGNHTVRALKLLGCKKVEAEIVEFPDLATAELYGIADNQSSNLTQLSNEALVKLFKAKRIKNFASENEIQMITGFPDKEFRAMLMSTEEMPDALPDVKIDGFVPSKSDFFVVQFENSEDIEAFRSLIGVKVAHQRVIQYEVLKPHLPLTYSSSRSTRRHKKKFRRKHS